MIAAGFILSETVDAAPQTHDSIFIEGDPEFTTENGVSVGTGTPDDPYVIDDLTIDGPERYAIYIKDTSKHLIIRNITISNVSGADVGIQLENVDNCMVQSVTMTGLVVNLYILHSQNILVSECDAVGGKLDLSMDVNITIEDYSRVAGQRGPKFHGLMADRVENLMISGCSISDLGRFGMYIISCTDFVLISNVVTNVSGTGILVKGPMGTSGNSVVDNRIVGCHMGFNLTGVPVLEVRWNEVWKNEDYGASISDCNEVVIEDNSFQHHGMYIEDVGCDPTTGFLNNTINGIPIVYIADDSDVLIEEDTSQVLVFNSTKVSIRDLELLGPIFVWDSYDVSIVGCFFEDSMLGIWVSDSTWTRIRNSQFTNCTEGIVAPDSEALYVNHCEFEYCDWGILSYSRDIYRGEAQDHQYEYNWFQGTGMAISAHHVLYGNISWNTIYNTSQDAIQVIRSKYVNVSENYIQDCGQDGIFINEGSWITICLNSIYQASNGTQFWSMTNSNITSNLINSSKDNGIWMHSGYACNFVDNSILYSKHLGLVMHGDNNFIHHNNFDGNYWSYYYPNPIQAIDQGHFGNQWDDGHEGNFWSDYLDKYPNANRTGRIWDIPYEISSGGHIDVYDRYPLVEWERPSTDPVDYCDAGEDVTVDEGSEVQFNGTFEHYDPENLTYTWEFTIGHINVTLNGKEPTYRFMVPGFYPVLLSVEDNWQYRVSDLMNVTVLDAIPPIVDAGEDITAEIFSEVTFDGSGSRDTGGISDYFWTIELEDETITLTGKTVDFLCIILGGFNVTLTVWDNADHYSSDTLVLTIVDMVSPEADAGPDREILQFETVELDASGSTDNVGVEQYIWTIELEGGTVTLDGKVVTYTFDEAGDYLVSLTVLDASGNEDETQITIDVKDRVAPSGSLGGDKDIKSEDSLTLDASDWSDNVDIIRYTWTIIGPDEEKVVRNGQFVTHYFASAGNYNVTLVVVDAEGNEASDSFVVLVTKPEPRVESDGTGWTTVIALLVFVIVAVSLLVFVMWKRKD